jgi:hypothetical protein
VDVSTENDWSQVRVGSAPIQDLGTTACPFAGFIYPTRDRRGAIEIARAEAPKPITPSRAFLAAFASFENPAREPLAARQSRRPGKPVDLTAQIARR